MKKAAALLASTLLYVGVFLLLFYGSMGRELVLFFLGPPLISAVYFAVVGGLFARHLDLSRRPLWLCMNLIGFLCGWAALLACFPSLLINGAVLLLLLPSAGAAAGVWAVVGLGILLTRRLRSHDAAPEEAPAAPRKEAGPWARRGKKLATSACILLLILAAASLYVAAQGLSSLRPADSYEDEGVHTFVPYDILPVQVRNNGSGRSQRLNSTKTVYMVYYRTSDGSGYQWQAEGGSVRELAVQLYNRGPVDRRVLSIPADNTYITVEAGQTAESYTASLQHRYLLILGLSGGYMLICLTVWVARRCRSQTEKVF